MDHTVSETGARDDTGCIGGGDTIARQIAV
jgi:hypothetical protein